MGLPRSEKARGRRTDERGPTADTDKKPKKKLDATAVWREARALVVARWGRIAIGLGLMLINRLAGLVLPASSKYLIDDVAHQGRADLLMPLALVAGAATFVQAIT